MTTSWGQFPLIYNFDIRFYLRQLSRENGRTMTLPEVPKTEIDKWSASHFDAIWLLGVWQSGNESRTLALNNVHLSEESSALVSDWKSDDICASPYSIADYSIAEALGGEAALAEFRSRLAQRGMKLILDFVPNHTALEHLWVGKIVSFTFPFQRNDSNKWRRYLFLDGRWHPSRLRARSELPCL